MKKQLDDAENAKKEADKAKEEAEKAKEAAEKRSMKRLKYRTRQSKLKKCCRTFWLTM
ncbi:alanine-zipper protein [Salmonella enterica]|uniref:alanine-zipper protein n=1 Tax=Salmonella enterica TaxID=28901 RepID=UPI0024536871|nr:alanine-zipper protein [Salmonella enterica]